MAVLPLVILFGLLGAQSASPKVFVPDVLLAYADEAVEAEKALATNKLETSKLLILHDKSPAVACYGGLADATRTREARTALVVDLVKNPQSGSGEGGVMRTLMDESPFREEIRRNSTLGYPMPAQFHRASFIDFEANGQNQSVRLPEQPLGKAFELPVDTMRLSSLPSRVPPALVGPRKLRNAIACAVPRTTSSAASLPLMQAGLKLLRDREERIGRALAEVLPPSNGTEITDADRTAALEYLMASYKSYGFASPESARSAFLGASLHKSESIGVTLTPKTPQSDRNTIGWTVLKL